MQVDVTITIAASPEHIWPVLIDVEHWPDWTPSVTRVQRLEPGPLELGSTARIRQPKLPEMTWRVTAFQPQQGFNWETRGWGAHTIGEHWISSQPSGTKLLLRVRQSGLLVPVFAPWISKLTRRYMEMEAQGLKRRCEQPKAAASLNASNGTSATVSS
jgi:hypothetical protein